MYVCGRTWYPVYNFRVVFRRTLDWPFCSVVGNWLVCLIHLGWAFFLWLCLLLNRHLLEISSLFHELATWIINGCQTLVKCVTYHASKHALSRCCSSPTLYLWTARCRAKRNKAKLFGDTNAQGVLIWKTGIYATHAGKHDVCCSTILQPIWIHPRHCNQYEYVRAINRARMILYEHFIH